MWEKKKGTNAGDGVGKIVSLPSNPEGVEGLAAD